MEQDHVQFFRRHNFAVGLSIDGRRDVNDRNRLTPDHKGSFDLVLPKARMAVEGDLRVELVLVADPTTARDLARSVRYLHETTGASFYTISFNIHTSWTPADLDNLEKGYRELGEYYVELFNARQPIQIDFLNNKMNVLLRHGFIREFLCEIGKTDLAVMPDGRIYPCLRLAVMDSADKTVIGTVEEGLDSERVRALRAACDERYLREAWPPKCHACAYPESCLNWCAASNLAMTGHPARVGDAMCRHEKVSMDVAQSVLAQIDGEKYRTLYADYFVPQPWLPLTPATPHGEARAGLN